MLTPIGDPIKFLRVRTKCVRTIMFDSMWKQTEKFFHACAKAFPNNALAFYLVAFLAARREC